MDSLDGSDVNMLQYFKDNNIPHTYQCSSCGAWMGQENDSESTKWDNHKWVIRDLTPFIKAGEAHDAISNRDDSLSGAEANS